MAVIIWVFAIYLQSCHCFHDQPLTLGNDFYLTFMKENYIASDIPRVSLYNPHSGEDAEINLRCPGQSFDQNITVHKESSMDIELPNALFFHKSGTEITDKVLRVTSLYGMSGLSFYVKGITENSGHVQVYDVIPVDRLGTNYIVAMACPNIYYFIHIILAESTLSGYVSVEFPNKYPGIEFVNYNNLVYRGGETLSILLNQVAKAAIIQSLYDLSGTKIISQMKVSVFTGCDFTVNNLYYQTKQQVPTTNTSDISYYYGRHYFVVSTDYKHSVKILKVSNLTTSVVIQHSTCVSVNLTDLDPWSKVIIQSDSAEIFADSPVAVVHIIAENIKPTPYFYFAIPVEHYTKQYKMAVPHFFSPNIYSIAATIFLNRFEGNGSEIRINGFPISANWTSETETPLDITNIMVTTNIWNISSDDDSIFSGYIFGIETSSKKTFVLPFVTVPNEIYRTCEVGDDFYAMCEEYTKVNCTQEEISTEVVTTTADVTITTEDITTATNAPTTTDYLTASSDRLTTMSNDVTTTSDDLTTTSDDLTTTTTDIHTTTTTDGETPTSPGQGSDIDQSTSNPNNVVQLTSSGQGSVIDQSTSYPNTVAPCVCNCPDDTIQPVNMTDELIAQIEEIRKELTVDKSTLSSVVRTKISADDPRPSAKFVGGVGIAMLTVVFGFLFISDFTTLFSAIKDMVQCKPL